MKKETLTACEAKIQDFYVAKRRMPSYAEMLEIFGVRSKNAVFKRVAALVREKFFDKDTSGRLLPTHPIWPKVPLAGLIRAGFPSPAEEELLDLMSLDEYLIPNPRATYLLKVEGDSMAGAGIHHGDLVLVQKGLDPKAGDIVVAKIDNEWTLKYFKQKGKVVYLESANDKYPAIIPRQELVIAGTVIANVRKYR